MALSLAQQKLVITGVFEGIDAEDLHWDLIAMGAFVKKSVTKTTSALIAGDAPEMKHLKAAKKHGTPIVGRAGLDALLSGASLDVVLAGDLESSGERVDLSGWEVAISGRFANRTQASIRSTLESLGARVVTSASTTCDLLVVGGDHSSEAIRAMDAGVPFIGPEHLTQLFGGAPISDFVASPAQGGADRAATIARNVDDLTSYLYSLREPSGAWETELLVTVPPDGRVVVTLEPQRGTPVETTVRLRAQKMAWPIGEAETTMSRKIIIR
jgi:BRCT domain type II-containing protein